MIVVIIHEMETPMKWKKSSSFGARLESPDGTTISQAMQLDHGTE